MSSSVEQLAFEKKTTKKLTEAIISKDVEIASLKSSLLSSPTQPNIILLVRQLHISHWEKIKAFFLTLQPTL